MGGVLNADGIFSMQWNLVFVGMPLATGSIAADRTARVLEWGMIIMV